MKQKLRSTYKRWHLIDLAYRNKIVDGSGKPVDEWPYKFTEINSGWYGLVYGLIEELLKQPEWQKMVIDVKKLNGSLAFYTSLDSDEIFNIVSLYEEVSTTICDRCGNNNKQSHCQLTV